MNEHYPPDTLAVSRKLFDDIQPWAESRGGVTLIGGWAVYLRVKPGQAQQSRDIDLVFHDDETLRAFSSRLKTWGLQWRTKGRNRFNDCHLVDDDPQNIRVDVMKSHDFPDTVFRGPRMRGAPLVKEIPTRDWLPDVAYLVQEKLATVPKRIRDRDDKRLKDLVDVHNLVFHNREAIDSLALYPEDRSLLSAVDPLIDEALAYDRSRGARYTDALGLLQEWVRAGLAGPR